MVAHGMSDRQFLIYQKTRALHYLLEMVPNEIETMRNNMCAAINRLAEEQSEGDEEVKKSIESYYLDTFNTQIPDNMEQSFYQSMIVQIYSFVETTLKDMVVNKSLSGVCIGGSLTKLERYYLELQAEKSITLPNIAEVWPDWNNFKEMRKVITHDGAITISAGKQYLSATIDTIEKFLNDVEMAI